MSATTAPSQTDHAQPPRLLVAEDSSITQDLLKLVLSQRGYAVDIVDSGTAALEALRDTPYDVALLDFHLPGMDGVEVVSAYTADTTGPHPRFIAITGDAEGLLSHAGNCEQFDEIIPKPVDIEEVCRVLETPRKTPEAGAAERSGCSDAGQRGRGVRISVASARNVRASRMAR